MKNSRQIEVLKGLTLSKIHFGHSKTEFKLYAVNCVYFETACGRKFEMYHIKDCCEDVYLESIDSDLNNLIGSPIIFAECVTSKDAPDDRKDDKDDDDDDSNTWTFYKLATIKDSVTFRWHGSSNGYYSEQIDFFEIFEYETD
jgi:hypothetical protein